jgi:hypothetical protein
MGSLVSYYREFRSLTRTERSAARSIAKDKSVSEDPRLNRAACGWSGGAVIASANLVVIFAAGGLVDKFAFGEIATSDALFAMAVLSCGMTVFRLWQFQNLKKTLLV